VEVEVAIVAAIVNDAVAGAAGVPARVINNLKIQTAAHAFAAIPDGRLRSWSAPAEPLVQARILGHPSRRQRYPSFVVQPL